MDVGGGHTVLLSLTQQPPLCAATGCKQMTANSLIAHKRVIIFPVTKYTTQITKLSCHLHCSECVHVGKKWETGSGDTAAFTVIQLFQHAAAAPNKEGNNAGSDFTRSP